MSDFWIGVTGFYATDNPHPGLAVVRALRQADPSWRILALTGDNHGTGAFATDLIDAHAMVPNQECKPLLNWYRRFVKGHPLHMVIPTLDAELPHYVAIRKELKRLRVSTCLPTASALRRRAKRRLPSLGRKAGVEVPETIVIQSVKNIISTSVKLRYPQVIKAALVDSAVVHSAEEFRVAGYELAAQWGYPLLSQPLVPGEEYDVAGIARRGELIGAAVMKKLSTTNKGTAWAGVTVEEPRLIEMTRRLIRELMWDGAIEVEFIRQDNGNAYCIEINPRFPSWIALTPEAGANLPEGLVKIATNQLKKNLLTRPGRFFARAVVEQVFPNNPLKALKKGQVKHFICKNGNANNRPQPSGRGGSANRGTIGITGLNAADNPSPGLTVARALQLVPTPPKLIGLTHEILSSGIYVNGIWDEVRLLPFPSQEERRYGQALIDQCRDAGLDCLIPTLDIEVPVVSRLARKLAEIGVATLVPSLDSLGAAAKSRLPDLESKGFRIPQTETVRGWEDLPRVARKLGFPFFLKGPISDARAIWTYEEMYNVAGRLVKTWAFPLIAQEYVKGGEFAIAGVATRSHRVIGSVAVRKNIQTQNGNTWGGTVIQDQELNRLAFHFAKTLKWVGPFELEFIRRPRSGYFLIEANPRFPSWIFLSAGAGANLPWAAVRLARGERVSSLTPRVGSFYVRMAWDATAPVERMGELAVNGKLNGHGTK